MLAFLDLLIAILRTVRLPGDSSSSRLRYNAQKRGDGFIGMTHKFPAKPRFGDGRRHNLFVGVTQRPGALDDVKRFEKAFQRAFKSAIEERRLLKATWRTSNEPRGLVTPGIESVARN